MSVSLSIGARALVKASSVGSNNRCVHWPLSISCWGCPPCSFSPSISPSPHAPFSQAVEAKSQRKGLPGTASLQRLTYVPLSKLAASLPGMGDGSVSAILVPGGALVTVPSKLWRILGPHD